MNKYELHHGECLEVLDLLPDNSVDSIVTDPPYGLNFMGKKWDYDVPEVSVWAECLRVLKPGGHLLAFAGARTYHRMAVRIEDANFEIRDQIMWLYGSGFPKSHNGEWGGTALKPAHEPIVVARKPLIGTVEQNHRAHGVGGLRIDDCRVGNTVETWPASRAYSRHDTGNAVKVSAQSTGPAPAGRWPANLIHDGSDEVLDAFPQAPGQLAVASTSDTQRAGQNTYGKMKRGPSGGAPRAELNKSAARFFYCAKASKSDRGTGNNHPTVKPTALMRYLCRLVAPPGGVVLDPFMGSGSTGKAAVLEGFKFVGIERDETFFRIATDRISMTADWDEV